MLPFPLYFLLFLPFLSLVAARWDELNAANIPNDANATYTFPDGILMVNCTAENNPVRCDVYLDARFSVNNAFKFEFSVCSDQVSIVFLDDPSNFVFLPIGVEKLTTVVINSNKAVTSSTDLHLPPLQNPVIPGADSIVKIKVILSTTCSFKLLDGKAFILVPDPPSSAGSKSAVSTTQIGIIVGSCVGGVLLIVVVIVLVYCCWWKKRNKKDKNKEVQDAKNPLLNEHALTESTDGAKPIDKEKNTVVNESKDKKASKAVTKKSEIPDVVADSNKEGVSSQKAPKSIVDVPKEDKKQGAATPKEKRPRRLSAATPRESTEHVKVATPKAPKNRSKSVGSMLDTDKDPKVVAVIKRNKTMDVAPTQEQTLPVDATQEYEGEAIIAALEKVKNRRLKFLLDNLSFVMPRTKTVDGKKYWLLPSADDSRKTPDDFKHIMGKVEEQFQKVVFHYMYGAYDQEVGEGSFWELKRIRLNALKLFERGPPRLDNMEVNDMVLVDFYHKYLRCVFLIDGEQVYEMAGFMNADYQKLLTRIEFEFLTADFENATSTWKALLKDREEYMEKNRHRKSNLESLFEFLKEDSPFHRLCWFYELYGKYVSSFPLNPHIFTRIPLQGLMLLLMRPDLSPEMEYNILMWFKVTSFSLLKKKDIGLSDVLFAYPISVMAKLWYEFDYAKVTEDYINKMRELLDFDEPEREDDWKVYDSVPKCKPE